jgi:hypothetical protein
MLVQLEILPQILISLDLKLVLPWIKRVDPQVGLTPIILMELHAKSFRQAVH